MAIVEHGSFRPGQNGTLQDNARRVVGENGKGRYKVDSQIVDIHTSNRGGSEEVIVTVTDISPHSKQQFPSSAVVVAGDEIVETGGWRGVDRRGRLAHARQDVTPSLEIPEAPDFYMSPVAFLGELKERDPSELKKLRPDDRGRIEDEKEEEKVLARQYTRRTQELLTIAVRNDAAENFFNENFTGGSPHYRAVYRPDEQEGIEEIIITGSTDSIFSEQHVVINFRDKKILTQDYGRRLGKLKMRTIGGESGNSAVYPVRVEVGRNIVELLGSLNEKHLVR